MTSLQEKILGIFKDHRTPVNGFLRQQSIDIKVKDWDRRSLDEAPAAMDNLIADDYLHLSIKDGWYILTEKGYGHIFKDYSIADTENVILEVVKTHKVGVGNIIISNWFTKTLQSIEQFHFDNFGQAIQNIIDKGFFEVTDRGWKLTQAGYDKIY